MGHSKRTFSVVGSRGFKGGGSSRDKTISEYIGTVDAKNASEIVDYAVQYILPALPDGSTKLPVYYSIKYGGQFILDAYNHDIDYALKNLGKSVTEDLIIPAVVDGLWSSVGTTTVQYGANTALQKFAEDALKEAMFEVLTRGVDAL